MMDQRVLEPVGPTLGKKQPFLDQAPLVADVSVQRMAGIELIPEGEEDCETNLFSDSSVLHSQNFHKKKKKKRWKT